MGRKRAPAASGRWYQRTPSPRTMREHQSASPQRPRRATGRAAHTSPPPDSEAPTTEPSTPEGRRTTLRTSQHAAPGHATPLAGQQTAGEPFTPPFPGSVPGCGELLLLLNNLRAVAELARLQSGSHSSRRPESPGAAAEQHDVSYDKVAANTAATPTREKRHRHAPPNTQLLATPRPSQGSKRPASQSASNQPPHAVPGGRPRVEPLTHRRPQPQRPPPHSPPPPRTGAERRRFQTHTTTREKRHRHAPPPTQLLVTPRPSQGSKRPASQPSRRAAAPDSASAAPEHTALHGKPPPDDKATSKEDLTDQSLHTQDLPPLNVTIRSSATAAQPPHHQSGSPPAPSKSIRLQCPTAYGGWSTTRPNYSVRAQIRSI